MADTENKNNKLKDRREMQEAFLYCIAGEDIERMVMNTFNIADDKEQKTADRLKAIDMIFEYTVRKPNSGLDINGGNKPLKDIIFKFEEDGAEDNNDNAQTETSPSDINR